MTAVTRTTELEAINTMLNCINEAPISSLEVSGLVDVAVAKSVLNEVSREVQERGWHFNTEDKYPLPRNVSNEIPLSENMLRVDTTRDYEAYNVVQRGSRLYWLDHNGTAKHTYTFDKDLEGEVVFLLPWDELPEAARQYIKIRAARRFQARQLGSDTKHKFSEQEELEARASLISANTNAEDLNMFTGSWSVAQILDR
jgi:hypothetical protein